MKKRLKRKLHKKYINDVTFEVSTSDEWRERLFKSELGTKYVIDKNVKSLPKYLRNNIAQYNLRYYVSIIDGTNISSDIIYSFFDNYDEENRQSIFFKFEAIEYPDIEDYSLNA